MILPTLEDICGQLDEARAAREHLDRVITWLEEGTRLLDPNGGGSAARA